MTRLKSILFAILSLAAALPAAASGPAGRVREYHYDAAGNILQIDTDVFTYDGVDRVTSGTVNGTGRLYQYDAFGNRTVCLDAATSSTCQFGALIDSTANRIDAAQYDAAGNLTSFGGRNFTYDDTGMMTASDLAEYVYTADDERIAVVTGAQWSWSLRDASNKVLRELTSTANADGSHSSWEWRRDNVFRSGTLLSSVDPAGTRHYHTDHLGTPRLVTNTAGTRLGEHDYFAFGLEVPGNLTEPTPARLRFTGHERDADGMDYMHARFYEAQWGRFLSVDPGRDWDSAHPQSWNLYAYVRNNPINVVDPSGRAGEKPEMSRWERNQRAMIQQRKENRANLRQYAALQEAREKSLINALRSFSITISPPTKSAVTPSVEVKITNPGRSNYSVAAEGKVKSPIGTIEVGDRLLSEQKPADDPDESKIRYKPEIDLGGIELNLDVDLWKAFESLDALAKFILTEPEPKK